MFSTFKETQQHTWPLHCRTKVIPVVESIAVNLISLDGTKGLFLMWKEYCCKPHLAQHDKGFNLVWKEYYSNPCLTQQDKGFTSNLNIVTLALHCRTKDSLLICPTINMVLHCRTKDSLLI